MTDPATTGRDTAHEAEGPATGDGAEGLRIRCLGPLEALRGGQPVKLGGPRQRLVLAHLLIRPNETVAVERLIRDVWDDDAPQTARGSVQTYISHLRRALGADRIASNGQGYTVRVRSEEFDRSQFDALVAEGQRLRTTEPDRAATILRDALDLWRGPPFADLADAASLQPEITRLTEARMAVLEARIGADLDAGRDLELVGELEALVAANPLRERLWGQLMLALYRAGRQGDALAAFERVRGLLSDELGVDPSDELRALHRQVLQQDSALRSGTATVRGYALLERVDTDDAWVAWRARRHGVDRDVRLKVARAGLANDPDFIRRFEADAQRVAGIEHPNVVPLQDFWREPDGAYLVERHLRGGSLAAVLDGAGPPDRGHAERIAHQVTDALAAAHRHGVAHGNLDASSVLLDGDGNAYLTDFAIGYGAGTRDDAERTDRDALDELVVTLLAEVGARPDTVAPAARSGAVDTEVVRNPYKGLRAFTERDADDYFGRSTFVAHLLSSLRDQGRFLAVVGPSGSGKSSVVRAGLVPAVRDGALEGSRSWFVIQMVPGDRPFEELATALRSVVVDPPPDLATRLADGGLPAATALLPDDGDLLLVIDQFEELFTLVTDDRERTRFIDALVEAVDAPDGCVHAVVTLRADFYDRPLTHPRLGAQVQAHTATLLPLTATELERAITAPAERAGVTVERPLVAQMVADVVDQPGALPLLQYALTELFDGRQGAILTASAYRQIGGIAGALSRRADAVYTSSSDGARDAARQLFLQLVTPGEGVEDTRRRVPVTDVTVLAPDVMPAVLDAFGAARLLSFDRDPETRAPTVEVAHEALLREWPRLRGWVDVARDDLRTQRRLRAAAADWTGAGRDPSYLATGAQLTQYETWRTDSRLTAIGDDDAYIAASIARRDEEQAEEAARRQRELDLERRSVRRLRTLVAVLGVAALVAGVLTIIAITQGRRAADQTVRAQDEALRAERAARVATARELAAAADANLDVDPERSMLLAIEAIDATRSAGERPLREAAEALHRAVHESRVERQVDGVGGLVDWSPNGDVFVGESPDILSDDPGAVVVRRATDGEPVRSWNGHDNDLNDAVFSPDGRLLASVGDDGALRVWDARTGALRAEHVERLDGEVGRHVRGLSFSPDGRRVAAVFGYERLRVLDVASNEVVTRASRIGAPFNPFRSAYSPDGREIAVPSYDANAVVVFDARTGERTRQLADGRGIGNLAWSPDGRWIAAGWAVAGDNLTNETVVFDAARGDVRYSMFGHSAVVNSVDWTPDSTQLATSSADGTVRIWTIRDDGAEERLALSSAGMSAGVGGVAFSPDGTRLLAGQANTERTLVWDVSSVSGGTLTAVRTSSRTVEPVVPMADGTHVLLAGRTHAATMWNPTTGERIRSFGDGEHAQQLAEGGGLVAAVADTITTWDAGSGERVFTADLPDVASVAVGGNGALVAVTSGTSDPTRLLDRSGNVVAQLEPSPGHQAWNAEFSRDGATVAVLEDPTTPDSSGQVRLWDVATGRVVLTLEARSRDAAFSPDGAHLALAEDDGGSVWDLADGSRVSTLSGHEAALWSVAFAPDGKTVATASQDGTVRLWDPTSGLPQLVLPGHDVVSAGLAFVDNGDVLVSGSGDGVARVWALDIDDLIGIAQDKLTRDLNDAECREYLHVDACP